MVIRRKIAASSAQFNNLIKASPSPHLAKNNFLALLDIGGAKAMAQIPRAELPNLFRVLGGSGFLSEVLIRQEKEWPNTFLRQIRIKRKSIAGHAAELNAAISDRIPFAEFCAALRQHKQREYLLIGARDLMPAVTMEETVQELSALAEAAID